MSDLPPQQPRSELPAHPAADDASAGEHGKGVSWAMVFVVGLIGLVVMVVLILHLIGVVGPAGHR